MQPASSYVSPWLSVVELTTILPIAFQKSNQSLNGDTVTYLENIIIDIPTIP